MVADELHAVEGDVQVDVRVHRVHRVHAGHDIALGASRVRPALTRKRDWPLAAEAVKGQNPRSRYAAQVNASGSSGPDRRSHWRRWSEGR